MSRPPAIRIRGLGRYFGPPLEIDGVTHPRQAWRSLMRIAGVTLRDVSDGEIQATVAAPGDVLQDITLDIEQGSVVCLIGASGSGKSVLLRILAGVLPPTTGRIEFYGPVTSLLSMGENLNARLTADENIRASRSFQDRAPAEAERYAAEVIAFAGLEGFEHAALRTYSSGMIVRLNVALALCGSPAIVLIDDVINVGDIGFQQKCVERVHALKAAGSTLVLAFSDEALVQQLATRVITLAAGRIVGDTSDYDAAAVTRTGGSAELEWQVSRNLPEDNVLAFRSVGVDARPGEPYLDLHMDIAAKVEDLRCRPLLSVASDGPVLLFRSLFPEFVATDAAGLRFTVRVPTDWLPAGRYTLALAAAARHDGQVFASKSNDTVALTIRREAVASGEGAPLLQPALVWDIERVADVPAAAGVGG